MRSSSSPPASDCAICAGYSPWFVVQRSSTDILPRMQRFFRDVAGPSLAPRGSVVCVGAFDGVHCGHQAVLARVRERALALGLTPIAISFEPLPREFFARGTSVGRLTAAGEKINLLVRAGMQHVLSLRFNTALAAM